MNNRCTDLEHEHGDYGSCITCNQIAWARNHPAPSPTDPPSVDREALAKAIYDSYQACWHYHTLPEWQEQPPEIHQTNRCRVDAVLADLSRQGLVVLPKDAVYRECCMGENHTDDEWANHTWLMAQVSPWPEHQEDAAFAAEPAPSETGR